MSRINALGDRLLARALGKTTAGAACAFDRREVQTRCASGRIERRYAYFYFNCPTTYSAWERSGVPC